MTEAPGGAGSELMAQLAALLVQVTGEDEDWAANVTPDARLEGDLKLDSVELAALAVLLAAAFGDRVDLERLLASLEIDELLALTAGDLASYIADRTASRAAGALG